MGKKLIDLTARNSLLSSNLKPTNTSSLRFVDELPNQVFNYIIEEGNSMYLQAVPLPSEEEFWRLKSFDEETLKEKLSELDPEERKKLEEDLDEYLSRTAIDHAKSLNINTSYEVPIEVLPGQPLGQPLHLLFLQLQVSQLRNIRIINYKHCTFMRTLMLSQQK